MVRDEKLAALLAFMHARLQLVSYIVSAQIETRERGKKPKFNLVQITFGIPAVKRFGTKLRRLHQPSFLFVFHYIQLLLVMNLVVHFCV